MRRTEKLARLLHVLHSGEQLAAQVAAQQSRLAPAAWMQRALGVQALQEHGHAAMACSALVLIGRQPRAWDVMLPLRERLARDMNAANLANSLLGLQGVVEHLGETLLDALGAHQHPAGFVLHALRTKVLAQERGHTQLGARCLQTLDASPHRFEAIAEYRALGKATALSVATLLDDARLDANVFWTQVDARLSHWQESALLQ